MTEQRRTRFLFPCLLACVVAALLAVGLMVWVPYQREQSVRREIERMGGTVFSVSGGPEWLREWIGYERMQIFDKVVVVDLDGTQVSDTGLEHLKGLTNLQVLWLTGTQVTDAGLEHLKDLTNLKYLSLGDTQVTDAGLVHLKGLTNLQELWLDGTRVTDAGAEKLKNAIGDHLTIDR